MSETCKTNSATEPKAGSAAMPVWILISAIVLFFGGGMYFDAYGGWFNQQVYPPYRSVGEITIYQPDDADSWKRLGAAKFEAACSICHGSDGKGKPGTAPPLAGSEWVLTDVPAQVIVIPLHGLTGPITVKGVEYNLNMPAVGSALDDEQYAAVLSYIRISWGNKASRIMPEQVTAVRTAHASRKTQWTADELKKLK